MAWAISLIIAENEGVEARLLQVLEYLSTFDRYSSCTLTIIDATGITGNSLSEKVTKNKSAIKLDLLDMVQCAREEGQIFELDLLCGELPWQLTFVIRRGSDFDIVGFGDRLPPEVTGEFIELDTKLYNL